MIALILALQTADYYWTAGYSPDFLLRTRPWQGVAIDSRGRIHVVHPCFRDAGNKPACRGRIRVFDSLGEPLALFEKDNFIATGLALDERNDRLLHAADFLQVGVLDLKTLQPTSLVLAKKESGRCVGVSLARNGDLLTADMAQSKVFRFYAGGHHSSFGSGPGEGDQGFNHLRRVYESPVSGNLYVLDASGTRVYSAAGRFLKRISTGGVLAMGPDGRHLVTEGPELILMDADSRPLKRFPFPPDSLVDAALAKDGSFVVLPRGEEHCAAAYDVEGRLRWRRGADFERLTVSKALDVALVTGLEMGLLTPAEAKAAQARPRRVSIFARADGGGWQRVERPAPGRALRFTTAAEPEGPGARVDVPARP